MKASTSSKFIFAALTLFAFAAIPAFAQRGGGSHSGGGGFHGGGGGSHSSGGSYGGFRGGASSPSTGNGFSRGASSAPSAGYGARPAGNAYRSVAPPVSGVQRPSNFSSAPAAQADGQWHSFGNGSPARGSSTSQSEVRGSANTGGGWHVFGGNRSATGGTPGATRSFSGQGSDVWENTPVAHNVVSSSRTLNNVRGSFNQTPIAGSVAGNSGIRTNSSLVTSSRLASGSGFGNRAFTGPSTVRFGNSYYGYRGGYGWGFRGGCWNCGYPFGFGLGWGPGWGFGWPWLGYWNSGLYWNDPWWGWPGYGGYGYPASYIYGYPYVDSGSNSSQPENYPDTDTYTPPVDQSSSAGVSGGDSAPPILLFMKDGSVDSVRDYWISGGQIHYIFLNGAESAIDMDQLDLQRTVDENAKSGVQFTLKPNPNSFAPAPEAPPAATSPSAPPGNELSTPQA